MAGKYVVVGYRGPYSLQLSWLYFFEWYFENWHFTSQFVRSLSDFIKIAISLPNSNYNSQVPRYDSTHLINSTFLQLRPDTLHRRADYWCKCCLVECLHYCDHCFLMVPLFHSRLRLCSKSWRRWYRRLRNLDCFRRPFDEYCCSKGLFNLWWWGRQRQW